MMYGKTFTLSYTDKWVDPQMKIFKLMSKV